MGQPQGVAPTVCYEPSPVGAAPYVRPSVPHTTKADPGVAQPDARNLARSDDTEPPTIPYPYSHCWRSIPRRGCSSGSSRCEISQATHTRTRAARHRNLTHPATPVTEAAAVYTTHARIRRASRSSSRTGSFRGTDSAYWHSSSGSHSRCQPCGVLSHHPHWTELSSIPRSAYHCRSARRLGKWRGGTQSRPHRGKCGYRFGSMSTTARACWSSAAHARAR